MGATVEVVEAEEVFSTTPDSSWNPDPICPIVTGTNNGIKSCLGLLSDEPGPSDIEICMMESSNVHRPHTEGI